MFLGNLVAVKSSARFVIMFCVFAGLLCASAHESLHGLTDECASRCDSGHGEHEDSNDDDHGHDHEGGTMPHHHACCQLPTADRASDSLSLPTSFQCILVEIVADRLLAPDEPVFALDKPPLI
jgi:hypothetical protein